MVPPAVKYKADGVFDQSSAVGTLILGGVVGAIVGVLASLVGSYGFYFIIIMPALMGGAIGLAMAKGVEFTKNRNPWVTAIAAVMASIGACSAMHLTDYTTLQSKLQEIPAEEREFALALKDFQSRDDVEMPLMYRQALADPEYAEFLKVVQVETFPEYMLYEADQGVSISSARNMNDDGINLGFTGTIVYWLIEMLIIAGAATSICWAQATAPFCSECDSWMRERLLGEVGMDSKQVAKALEDGRIATLDRQAPEAGLAELKLFRCDGCGSPDCSVVKVQKIYWYNGQKQRSDIGSYVVSEQSLQGLANVLNRAEDEFAVLHAIEELSDEVRQSGQPAEEMPQTAADQEHDQAMQDYMAKLTADQK